MSSWTVNGFDVNGKSQIDPSLIRENKMKIASTSDDIN